MHNLAVQSPSAGHLTVYTGPMWSGKSDALIARIEALSELYPPEAILALRPSQDTRDPGDTLVSRTGRLWPCVRFADCEALLRIAMRPELRVVAVDELNLLNAPEAEVVRVILLLKRNGKIILVSGLPLDFTGAPFAPIPALMGHADIVVKLAARCACCGGAALYSHRKVTGETQRFLVGADNLYEPRCCACFYAAQAAEELVCVLDAPVC
jgi:thymidine kinase